MKRKTALVHLSAALQDAGEATTWADDGADWLARWIYQRTKKLADERGDEAMGALCSRIRGRAGRALREAVGGDEITVSHLVEFETELQSSTWLCDPDEPGG